MFNIAANVLKIGLEHQEPERDTKQKTFCSMFSHFQDNEHCSLLGIRIIKLIIVTQLLTSQNVSMGSWQLNFNIYVYIQFYS